MNELLSKSIAVLNRFHEDLARGANSATRVDRPEIVAHATLSAWAHHWPTRVPAPIVALLSETQEIQAIEPSRWMTQRRIGLAKLVRLFSTN